MSARHLLWLERMYGLEANVIDPVLSNYRFTNIWRELDRGTVYLFNNVQQRFSGDTVKIICHSLLYRRFNLVDPYEKVVDEFGDCFYVDTNEADFVRFIETLPSLYSSAYTRLVNDMHKAWAQFTQLEDHALRIEKALIAGDSAAVRKALLKVYSVGPFTADQSTMDLCWPGGPFGDIDFSPRLGPGAQGGLKICSDLGYGDSLDTLLSIGDSAVARETRPTVEGLPIEFDMRALEHVLCEFAKYIKTKEKIGGRGAARRTYQPAAEPLELPFSWSDPSKLIEN